MGKFHETELPGEDLVIKGLEDLANGEETIESLLVSVGAPRLRQLRFTIPQRSYPEFPEDRLYRMLEKENSETAHSRLNAYVRRLVSFESALESLKR